jgi:hypothetical protein
VAVDLGPLRVQPHDQITTAHDRFGRTLRATHDSLHTGQQLVFVKRLGQVVVGPELKAFYLVRRLG